MVDKKDETHDEDGDSKSGIADTLKRLFAVGVGAAFLTEESIRNALGEAKLPKELLQSVLHAALKSKEELTNKVTREVLQIISKIDFVKEASRFVETHKFKISAEIEVMKKDTEE